MDTQLIVGIIVGVLMLFFAYKSSQVSGKQVAGVGKGLVTLIAVIVGLGALWVSGAGSYISPSLAFPFAAGVMTIPTDDGSPPPLADGCFYDGITATVSAVDKYTSASTGGTHRYSINGNPAKTVSDAGTISVSYNDQVDVLYGNETDGTYFGVLKSWRIPCEKYPTLSVQSVKNGTLTMEAFNDEGNKIDGGVTNQTIGIETVNVEIKLQGPDKAGFPLGGKLVLEVNGSEYDEQNIALTLTSGNLFLSSGASIPDVHTITATDRKTLAWDIGAIEGTNVIKLNLYLDSDDTNNPTDLNDPVLYFYPNDYFVDEDNNGAFSGPDAEDEDNVQTFLYKPSVTISVS